jgi:hypothetical protein
MKCRICRTEFKQDKSQVTVKSINNLCGSCLNNMGESPDVNHVISLNHNNSDLTDMGSMVDNNNENGWAYGD